MRFVNPRVIRAALSLAPGTWNPAWRYGEVIRGELGSAARIAIDPRQVLGKIGMRTMNGPGPSSGDCSACRFAASNSATRASSE